ncbi:MAG: hypothetical protein RSC41_05050, partial [Oscillospiraceae bacterium]
LQNMQNDLQKMDDDHEIRSLFTDTEKSDAARLLVDDIFELYDMNRTILDVLPKYITTDNVKVLEHFIDDIELVDLDEIEDSTILDDLEKLLVKNDNPINITELKTIVNTAHDMSQALKPFLQTGNVQTLLDAINELQKTVGKCPDDVKYYLLKILGTEGLRNEFISNGVNGVYTALGISTLELIEEEQEVIPAENSGITDETAGGNQNSDKDNLPEDNENKNNSSTEEDNQAQNPPANAGENENKDQNNDSIKEDETTPEKSDENQNNNDIKENETTSEKSDENQDKSSDTEKINQQVLAANNLDETDDETQSTANTRNTPPAPPSKDIMIGALKQLFAKAGDVVSIINSLNDDEKAALTILSNPDTTTKLQNMLTFFAENEESIDLTIKILNKTDSQEVRRISRALTHLRENIDDFKPQIYNLQKDIKKDGMRESLRQSPEMIRTLVKMNGDLEDNRNISDILKKAVSEENSETLKGMIGTLDRLIDEDAISGYVENVDDIKELLERKDALMELSNNQQSYAGAADDAETNVKFIMKTDEIKKPEPVKEEPVKEEPKGKLRSFFEKIFG